MRAFIIGNGFDLHHGMHTSYLDFKKYLMDKHPAEFQIIDTTFFYENDERDPWCNIEDTLSRTALCKPVSILNELNEKNNHILKESDLEYAHNLEDTHRLLSDLFEEWVSTLNVDGVKKDDEITFSSDDVFLSFNYTDTLENVYSIPKENVRHIHLDDNKPVIGHDVFTSDYNVSFDPSEVDAHLSDPRYSSFDVCSDEKYKESCMGVILNSVPIILDKRTTFRCKRHDGFLKTIDSAETIVIMGWSAGPQDMQYFIRLFCNPSSKHKKIIVVYYNESEIDGYKKLFQKYSVDPDKITYCSWKDIHNVFNGSYEEID